MTDFLISSTGDLVFSDTKRGEEKLTISFYKSNTAPLKVNMEFYNRDEIESAEGSFTIYFDFNKIEENKRVPLAKKDSYIIQQIQMRLMTSLGELKNRSEIGSIMETVMHKNINDRKVQEKVKSIVADAISDLVEDCTIKTVPFISTDNGYKQCLKVYIYRDNNLLTTYEME